jgi:hypothetical protein
VQRTPAAGATGPLASTKLLEAVFANEAVANKRNTDAVEVRPQPAGGRPRGAAQPGARCRWPK